MKISYLLGIACLLLFSCQSRNKQQQAEIKRLEATVAATPKDGPLDSLLLAYQTYITTYPNDKEQISSYLKNAQSLLDKRMTALRQETFDETTGVVNQEAAQEFIQLAERYAALLPDDKRTPEVLFQAGEVAGSVHQYDKTLALYQTINEKYPNYEKAPQALFMRAFTLDSELKRIEEARPLYEAFLQKYPKDDFADDAQFLLDNLGKSEEEIIRAFQEKQKQ